MLRNNGLTWPDNGFCSLVNLLLGVGLRRQKIFGSFAEFKRIQSAEKAK